MSGFAQVPSPKRRPTLLRHLVILLVVNGFAVNALIWLAAPAGYEETTLDHTWRMLQGKSGDDSWGAMKVALDQAERSSAPLYSEVFFKDGVRFQYPPSALFALEALMLGGVDRVRVADEYNGPWPATNDWVGWIFILLTAAATAALLESQIRRVAPAGGVDARAGRTRRVVLVFALAVTFYPVVKAFTLGQIQVWLNAFMALALYCWATHRRSGAGVLIGMVCLVKPHYGLVILWAGLRREWRFVGGAAAVVALGLAASIAAFGWTDHIDYLRVLSFLSRHGEAYYPNQSLNGLLNRLAAIGDPTHYKVLDFPMGLFPPFNPWIYGATLATSLAILASAVLRRRRGGEGSRIYDFATVLLSCTIASPIAWEHHYGVLLPIFALLFVDARANAARLALLAAAYVLAGNFFLAANLLTPTVLNPAQSYLFFGGIIVLVLLHLSPLDGAAHAAPAAPARAPASSRPAVWALGARAARAPVIGSLDTTHPGGNHRARIGARTPS
jgi:hypothetical protein